MGRGPLQGRLESAALVGQRQHGEYLMRDCHWVRKGGGSHLTECLSIETRKSISHFIMNARDVLS